MEGTPEVATAQEAVEDALAQAREADASSPEPLQVRLRVTCERWIRSPSCEVLNLLPV